MRTMFLLNLATLIALAFHSSPASSRVMETGDAAIVRQASPAVVNIAEWKVHTPTQPGQSPRRVKV